jgi:hypothetical protein
MDMGWGEDGEKMGRGWGEDGAEHEMNSHPSIYPHLER